MSGNPYSPPKAELADRTDNLPRKPAALVRFALTAAWAFPVYMAFVLPNARERWVLGAIGSLAVSLLSGLVAMCIPVRSKWGFVVPAIVAGLAVAAFLGNHAG